jgi:hypothetical protein
VEKVDRVAVFAVFHLSFLSLQQRFRDNTPLYDRGSPKLRNTQIYAFSSDLTSGSTLVRCGTVMFALSTIPSISTFNPLTQELNPSAQRCLPRIFTGDFNF